MTCLECESVARCEGAQREARAKIDADNFHEAGGWGCACHGHVISDSWVQLGSRREQRSLEAVLLM